jgi:hypothetical protein
VPQPPKPQPFSGQEPGAPEIPPHPKYGAAAAVYTYRDAEGEPLYYVCRYATDAEGGKTFLQGRPDDAGEWVWNIRGIDPVLYRWPEIAAHLDAGKADPIWICEGEADCDRLRAHLAEHGLPGTCTTNPMGAGKWRPEYTEALNGARHVIVVADNDEIGRGHALHVARELSRLGGLVELRLPALDAAKADLSDHLAAGLGLDALRPMEEPPAESEPESSQPFALLDTDFIALEVDAPEPLWGTPGRVVLPAGGLGILGGGPGVGKTTWVVDLAYRLAAGEPAYGTSVVRPLRVLLMAGRR